MVRCTVIGLGMLGCRIAVDLVSFGHTVYAYDKNPVQQDTLFQRIQELSQQLERDGLIDSDIQFHRHIVICSTLKEASEEVDFIFEAASENLSIKRAILKDVTSFCLSKTIIGTNTLNLTLESIVDDALFSERILGIRFIYPVFGIPIVEYTVSLDTSSTALNKTMNFFKSMGKKLIRKERNRDPIMLTSADVALYQREFKESRRMTARCHHGHDVDRSETSPNVSRTENSNSGENATNSAVGSNAPEKSVGEKEDCAVCLENQIDTIIFPCRHMWLCFTCATKLKSFSKPCPACRGNIEDIVAVFKP